ncbi:MAG: hypothetical protein ACLTLE_01905 [Lachnospiraceae bacterium]
MEIQINFNHARVQAGELEALAAEIHSLSSELTWMSQKLALCFQGDVASGCRRDVEAVRQMLHVTRRELSMEASQLRSTAARLYQAELQALARSEGTS